MARTYDLTGALPAGVTITPPSAQRSAGVSVTGTATTPPSYTIADARVVGAGGLVDEQDDALWLVVRLSATAGTWAGCYFDTEFDTTQYAFPIRGDGVMRTYNLWIGDFYISPRRQADVEAGRDPSYNAVASGDLGTNNKLIKFKSKIYPVNVSATVSMTVGSPNITFSSNNNAITEGMAIFGTGIPDGAKLASVARTGTSPITLSAVLSVPASETNATAAVTCRKNNLCSPITVFPTCASGGSGVVEFVKLAKQPEGPTVLTVDVCHPARALLRINRTESFGIRVRNMGSITATGLQLSFGNASPGLTFGTARNIPDRIPPDEDRTIFFEVTSSVAGSYRTFDVTVTCDQGDSVTCGARGEWQPAAPADLPQGQVPPVVRQTKAADAPLIGVWMFPAWEAKKNQYQSIAHTFERRPELGFYDQESPLVWEWNIKWLAEHGVDYMLVEWIDRSGYAKNCVENGLLRASNIASMKWQISYINGGSYVALSRTQIERLGQPDAYSIFTGTTTPSDGTGADLDYYLNTSNGRLYGPKTAGAWDTTHYVQAPIGATKATVTYACNYMDMFRRWIPYFSEQSYLKTSEINPRPRVNFISASDFYAEVNNLESCTRTIGTTAPQPPDQATLAARDTFVQTVIARCTQMAIDAGHPGISWDGGEVNSYPGWWASIGFERCSNYNWYGLGSTARVMDAANSQRYGEQTVWRRLNQPAEKIVSMVSVSTGFNHRRWIQPRAPSWVVVGWTYEVFLSHLANAKAFVNGNGIPSGKREILIEALDEWGEESTIGPCGIVQFKFLQAIRETFFPTSAGGYVPTIVGPSDVGMTIPQVPNLFRWVSTVTAFPAEDGNTNTKEGVQIPLGSSPAIEPARSIGCWTKLG